MAQATNYQCPACGGPLHFSGTTGLLECDYCGSSYTTDQVDSRYSQKAETDSAAATENLVEYNCPSCGARLFCDETTAASSCPYCGNNQVIAGQFKGGK